MLAMLYSSRRAPHSNDRSLRSRCPVAVPRVKASTTRVHTSTHRLGDTINILDISSVWLEAQREFGSSSALPQTRLLESTSDSCWQLHFFPCEKVAAHLEKDVAYIETRVKLLPKVFPDLQQWRFDIERFNIDVLAALVDDTEASKQRLQALQIVFPNMDSWAVLRCAPWLMFEPVDLTVLIGRLATLR